MAAQEQARPQEPVRPIAVPAATIGRSLALQRRAAEIDRASQAAAQPAR